MRPLGPRRLALWGLATPLFILPGLATAQDGRREVGPPVTTPRTNNNRQTPTTNVTPRVGSEVLNPVPATATDPAPPGTRVERVDVPATLPGTAVAPAAGAAADIPGVNPAATLPAGVLGVEGVIVGKIQRPGKDLPDEQIRITIDPARNWAVFGAPGSVSSAEPTQAAGKAKNDRRVDVVVTRRTALYTYARSPDGQVVPDPANPYAADSSRSRTGLTATTAPAPLISTTNFTVLKPDQFVAVQYRKRGGVNEAASLAVIVAPTTPGAAAVTPSAATTTTTPAAPAGVRPATGAPATGRIPRIPNTPVGAGAGLP